MQASDSGQKGQKLAAEANSSKFAKRASTLRLQLHSANSISVGSMIAGTLPLVCAMSPRLIANPRSSAASESQVQRLGGRVPAPQEERVIGEDELETALRLPAGSVMADELAEDYIGVTRASPEPDACGDPSRRLLQGIHGGGAAINGRRVRIGHTPAGFRHRFLAFARHGSVGARHIHRVCV
jgi:hypothetical protein